VDSQEETGFMVLVGVHWREKICIFLPEMAHKYMELYFDLFVVTFLSLYRPYIVRHTALVHMHRYHNKLSHNMFMLKISAHTVYNPQIGINQGKL
jgi:hypothetical protein